MVRKWFARLIWNSFTEKKSPQKYHKNKRNTHFQKTTAEQIPKTQLYCTSWTKLKMSTRKDKSGEWLLGMESVQMCIRSSPDGTRQPPHLTGWWRSRRRLGRRECSCPGSHWPAPPWQAARWAPPAPGGSGKATEQLLSIILFKQASGAQRGECVPAHNPHTCVHNTDMTIPTSLIDSMWMAIQTCFHYVHLHQREKKDLVGRGYSPLRRHGNWCRRQ